MKYIRVKFHNGDIFDVPAPPIAKDRTDYYAIKVDGHEPDSPEWKEEYEHSMKDEDELLDWVVNNVNWSRLRELGSFVDSKPFDHEFHFSAADVEVVEHE